MSEDSLESLRALRDQVAALQVVRCRMVHERVRIENGTALRVSRGGQQRDLVRMGLCGAETRARNLACGHTMARYVLLDAVRALHTACELPGAAHDPLRDALESVCNSIHLLDHQKGEAERQLALSSEMKDGPREGAAEEERASAAARWASEIKRLEAQFDAYAEQMREFRGAVLAHLDAAIRDGRVRGGESVPLLA